MKKIYLITDEKLEFNKLYEKTEIALQSGIAMLQYRAKQKDIQTMKDEIRALKNLTHYYNIPLIINDYVELAVEMGVDGAHLGLDDLDIKAARSIIEDRMLLGATAKTVEQAIRAKKMGADYLGVGALFPSSTKQNAMRITMNTLTEIKEAVNLPIYAIGGITESNLTHSIISQVDGIAVVSTVYSSKNIKNTIENILNKFKEFNHEFKKGNE